MAAFDAELFLATLALVGTVIVISALLSGAIERSGLPQAAVFLLLGALIGPTGLNLVHAGIDSPVLRVVSTLSLALVLFTDAVALNLKEVRRNGLLAFLVVGPGTLVSAVLMTLAAWGLLNLPLAAAAILGAALASTDPVLLRDLLRRQDIDGGVRQALRLESGMNDAVLLPIVLVAASLLTSANGHSSTNWGRLAIDLLLLGPAAGVGVGLLGVAALDLVRRQIGVRRDYESLYSLGVAFVAFAAAESVHGSGFLAAFAAGLTVAALDVELCDCFLEYGETTAEMALLFAFVLFGTSLIWTGFAVVSWRTVLFVVAVFAARPLAFLPALAFSNIPWHNRCLIAWFGPRGLSSLLLVMLAVFAGVGGSPQLLSICCLVVLVSIVIHGLSPNLLLRKEKTAPATPISKVPQAVSLPPVLVEASSAESAPHSEFVSLADLQTWSQTGVPYVLVDARTERTYDESDLVAADAVRLHPEHPVIDAEKLKIPKDAALAVFCA